MQNSILFLDFQTIKPNKVLESLIDLESKISFLFWLFSQFPNLRANNEPVIYFVRNLAALLRQYNPDYRAFLRHYLSSYLSTFEFYGKSK